MMQTKNLTALFISLIVCAPATAMGEKPVQKVEPVKCAVPAQLEGTNIIQYAKAKGLYETLYTREAVKSGTCDCPFINNWSEFYSENFPGRKPKDIPAQEYVNWEHKLLRLNEEEYGRYSIYLPFFNKNCRD